MSSTAHPSPQPKRHLDRFSRFRTGDRRLSLHFTMERPFPPENCPFSWGDLDSHLIHVSPGPREFATQTASRSVQPFLQGSVVWRTDRPTDRPTDHATWSVAIGRIYVCSTAMRHNNNIQTWTKDRRGVCAKVAFSIQNQRYLWNEAV